MVRQLGVSLAGGGSSKVNSSTAGEAAVVNYITIGRTVGVNCSAARRQYGISQCKRWMDRDWIGIH